MVEGGGVPGTGSEGSIADVPRGWTRDGVLGERGAATEGFIDECLKPLTQADGRLCVDDRE